MPLPARSKASLAALFRRLGAPDPEGWASSEVDEGIPQLLRYLVLRGAWKAIVGEEETAWVDASMGASDRQPDAPLAGVGSALKRMLALGVDRRDIAALVRGMQYETAFALLYLLDDPTVAWDDAPAELRAELENVEWGLVGAAGDGQPQPISSLHESLLGLDPTGREMRPPAPKR